MSDEHTKAVDVIEVRDIARLHPMARSMNLQNADPATIREMMTLQREWEAGEAKRAYTFALVELKRDLPTVIARDKKVDYGAGSSRVTYTHASLARVMDAVTSALTEHGFSLGWEPSTSGNMVTVACRLTHSGGHSEASTISAPIDTKGAKSQAQGVASTITLLQRYTALAILGIATADMVEPKGETDPSSVDSRANLAMVTEIRKSGRSLEDAITVAGLPVKEWRAQDLARIAAWLAPVEQEAVEAEIVGDEPTDVPIPEKLKGAAEKLGYAGWQIAAIVEECGGEDAALAKLRAEYKTKNPKP